MNFISDPDSSTSTQNPHVTTDPTVPTDGDSMDPYMISTICLAIVLGLLIIAIIVYFCCFNNEDDLENGHAKLGKYVDDKK